MYPIGRPYAVLDLLVADRRALVNVVGRNWAAGGLLGAGGCGSRSWMARRGSGVEGGSLRRSGSCLSRADRENQPASGPLGEVDALTLGVGRIPSGVRTRPLISL